RLLLLLLVHRGECRPRFPDLERLDLNLSLRGSPAGAAAALALVRHLPGRQADKHAGDGVVDHVPADLGRFRLRRGGEQSALLRIEGAGFLELAVALERLDGGGSLVIELAVDEPVVVPGPGEVELDGDALGERDRGVACRRRRRRRPVARGGSGETNYAFAPCRGSWLGQWRDRLCRDAR